jgi:hypothetical protein
MSEKHCATCKHFKDEGIDGFGFCVAFKCIHHCTGGGRCCAHQFNDNGWTEITPDNVDEIDAIDPNRVVIATMIEGIVFSSVRADSDITLKSCSELGGYYFFILPELKIE